jgi:Fe-S cluster biogenesis protein NfuA
MPIPTHISEVSTLDSEDVGKIEEAIGHFKTILAADGGELSLSSYDPSSAVVTIDYHPGTNEECATCVITPEDLGLFVQEAVESRGVPVESVSVVVT